MWGFFFHAYDLIGLGFFSFLSFYSSRNALIATIWRGRAAFECLLTQEARALPPPPQAAETRQQRWKRERGLQGGADRGYGKHKEWLRQ